MWRSAANSICFFLLIFLFIFSVDAIARTEKESRRYVADNQFINIKDQLEKPYAIIAVVQSDDPVTIIEESGNYYKIETAEGKQGWIAKQFLKADLPKTHIIKQLKQEVTDLKEQLAKNSLPNNEENKPVMQCDESSSCNEIRIKLSDAENRIAQLTKINNDLKQISSEQSNNYSQLLPTTENINIEQLKQTPEAYSLLLSEYEKRGKHIAQLQISLAKQEDKTRFLWFATGATVFLIGLLIGKGVQRKKSKFIY